MGQSNVIFGAIFLAFIVFITAKGELPTYINLLRGVSSLPAGTQTSAGVVQYSNNLDAQTQALVQEQNALDNVGINTVQPTSAITQNPLAYGVPQINASQLGQ